MAELNIFIYKKGDSPIHRTHPTVKIILLMLSSYMISKGNIFILSYFSILILSGFFITTLSIKMLFKDIKYLIILGVIISILQLSVKGALIYILRIGDILLLGTIFIGSTRPNEISPGIYNIVRSRRLAQNISLTINLIPTFIITWKEIELSARSRGVYIKRNPLNLVKGLLVPLLIETFKKADTISRAMDSRSYNGWIKEDIEDRNINFQLILLVLLPYLIYLKMP